MTITDYYQPEGAQNSGQQSPPKADQPMAEAVSGQLSLVSESTQDEQIVRQIKEASEQMLREMGLESAPEERKKAILETLDKRVSVAITKVVIEKSTPEQAEQIRKAIEQNGNIEDVVAPIVEKNPALQADIQKVLKDLYQKITEESKVLKNVQPQEMDRQQSAVSSQPPTPPPAPPTSPAPSAPAPAMPTGRQAPGTVTDPLAPKQENQPSASSNQGPAGDNSSQDQSTDTNTQPPSAQNTV